MGIPGRRLAELAEEAGMSIADYRTWLRDSVSEARRKRAVQDGRLQSQRDRYVYTVYEGQAVEGRTRDDRREAVKKARTELQEERDGTTERRLRGWAGANSRKTHCIRGHAFDAKNTHIRKNGSRLCRICNGRNYRKKREDVS